MILVTQAYIENILKSLLEDRDPHSAYYAGGTLCIDCKEEGEGFVLFLNLDETYTVTDYFGSSKSQRGLLSISNLRLLFRIYPMVKGFTPYLKGKFDQSCIRHLENYELLKMKIAA